MRAGGLTSGRWALREPTEPSQHRLPWALTPARQGESSPPPEEDAGVAVGDFSSLSPPCVPQPSREISASPRPSHARGDPTCCLPPRTPQTQTPPRAAFWTPPPAQPRGTSQVQAPNDHLHRCPAGDPASTAQAELRGLGLTPPSSPLHQRRQSLLPKRPPVRPQAPSIARQPGPLSPVVHTAARRICGTRPSDPLASLSGTP